jgi:RNA polymerase sigma factor (sigma-70 family)
VPPLLDDAYTLAKWLSHSPTDAEDIVQDAALRALQALSSVSVDRPKPWFLAIVRNAAMTFMARNRRRTVAYAGDMADLEALDLRQGDDAPPDPEQELIAQEDGQRLRQAIASLPSPFLETLVMRDINGLSYREIAEATEVPVGTVMSRLARARAVLAKNLRSEP